MPIYKVNGKTYDIPEEKVARFETAYPDAVVGIYDGGTGKEYEMPVSKVDKFKKTFPEWSYSRPAASGTSSGEGQEADSAGMAAVTDNVGTSGDERESTSGNKEEWKPTPIQKALMTGGIQASMARFDAKVDEGKRHLEEMAQYTNSGAAMTGGQVRDAGVAMDTGTGEAVKRYQTPTGELTTDRVGAEREASAYREAVSNMTVAGQLRRAGRDLEDLQRKREARVKEIHDKWAADQERNTAPLAAVLGAQTYTPSIEADTEYRALTVAIHQAEKRIQALQHESDRQEGKDVGFWRGFGEVVGDIKTWDFGYSDLLDAMTMLDATSKPSPNRPAKTDTQKEAEQTMLEQTYETQQAQSTYGQNDSFWNRAGVMTGEMLPFMLDFAIMGGAKGGTSMVTRNLDAVLLRSLHKAAPKVARNKAVQWTTKALGAMPEDLLYRAPLMTNTVQGMKTSADIIDRKLGDVVIRDDGTYDFSNDKTWGSAIWQGEANAIIENYSEMFGTHLEGVLSLKTVGKLADTFGAKRLSGILTKASNSELAGIAGTMQKHLNQLGVSDYFGEVGEEYYGQLWRTMLDLDDAYKQNPDGSRTNLFLDGQFHGDIWGGMALSMGLLGAGKYSISAAAYGSMKHRVNKTDARASEIFTPEVWDGWRERIDGTTNDKIGEMSEAIVADPTLTDEQRTAAMNYMEASLNLRGFNLASVANQRGGEMSEDEIAANESYMDGYSASTPQEMNDAKKMLDLQRQRLASALSEDLVQDFDNDPIGALSITHDPELRRIASDYVNAKMVYDGMIQRVRDDIDGRIARSDAMIDSRINRETGMLQPATVRDVDSSDGRRVYIVNGSVAMYDDGTGVDARKSSESIIIRDAETSKVEFADAARFLGVDEAIDAETEKEAAREQIRQEMAQAAANSIDGVLSFTPGDSYSILDAEGNQQPVTVLGNSVDEEGLPVDGSVDVQYADGTIQSVVTSELQQMVDAASTQRVEQFDQEREAQRATAESINESDKSVISDESSVNLQDGNITGYGHGPEQNHDERAQSRQDDGGGMVTDPAGGVAVDRDRSDIRMYEEGLVAARDEHSEYSERDRREAESERLVGIARAAGQYHSREDVFSRGETAPGKSEQTALSRVPTDERGEPVYEDAEPDTAWDALVEQSEGDEDIAMEVAADIVAEKEKEYKAAERALKKAIEGKPETARGDGELTMAERIAAKKASKTAIVKARGDVEKTRSVLEHWQLIAGTMQRRVDAEKNAALQEQQQWEEAKNRMDKRVRETSEKYRDLPEVLNILEQTDPQSIDEVAAWVLSRYKVLWGSRRNGDTGNVVRAGVQHHTGIGEGERRRLFGLFASEANGGRSIESLAEDVFEEACNQFGVAYDNGQALDALIDVIKGATTRSDITNYIVNNRIARAETEGDALHRYYEDAEAADREYHERYGMGETEWMEFYASHGAEIELPDDVFQELMTNLGGLKADEEYERGEIQESAADTTGRGREESVYTEGTGVGSEGWLDDHGDAAHRETEGGTTRGELVQDSLDEGGGEQSEVRGNDENGEEDVFSRMERIARNETLRTDIRDAEAEVNTEPTDKQKEAGNYKKGHVQVGTFDVTIENPKGSKRSGRDTDGKQWETTMTHTYGYIRGTKGVDGDHIDVYLSSDIDGWNGRKAFVVDQYNPDGSFDEHKVMLGFKDKDEAFEAYLSNYETGWDNGRRLDVTAVNLEDFEKWIDSSMRKTKPIADYVNIKKAVSASSQGSVADYKSGNNDNQSYSLINVVRDLYSKGKEYASRLYQRSFFNVAKTPEFMKTLGLTGNNFTIRYGVIARHFGKDGSHDISEDGWEKLPDALTKPFAITKLSDKDKGFRLYTTLQNHNGEYIVVGVDVKNVGRDLEVNAIATVFGRRDNAGTTLQEEIIYTDKNITPEQQSLLDGPNSHQYTAERELSKDKVNALSANKQTDSKESSDGYRIEPKPYTNKHGKTLDTYLVTFNRDFFVGTKRQGGFSKQEKSSLRAMAKDKKGWYDKETGGWMLRSREDAEVFARTVMSKNSTQLSEEAPLSLDDMQSATKQASEEISPIKLETTPTNSENSSPSEETPVKEKTVNPSGNKLVTDEQYAELLAKMRKKMGGQLNIGVDPEILAIGSMMAVYHIEKGARKFAEYVKAMVADLGEKFPARYLKGFYKAAHEMIEDAAPEIAEEMDSDDIVNTADVASIISGHIDAMVTAEMVIEEEKADKEREEAEQKLKDERNIRLNPDGSTTETIIEGGTEIAVTKGDFIPGVRPAADNEKKAEVKKRPGKSKPKPGTDGGLFDIDEKETASAPSIIVPESRPVADLMGDSSAYQDREAQTAELVEEIGGVIESRVMMLQLDAESVKPLTMTEVKKIATKYSALKDISDTDLQELVELAMTQLTRSEAIVNVEGTAEQQRSAYDHIVNLYKIQPSLNARDSERLIKQQYSTPTPFGYVMGQFVRAGGKAVGSMLEPSAGNGALTITVHPSLVHVNDIDEARLANLRKLGYGQVTAQDALLPFTGDKVDVVMTNPPFGTVTEKVYDGVFHVSSLEGQMAINALDKMKDDGRAAIVIGGNTSYRTNGSMNPKDAAFFGYLYSHYNVADVINISGKSLYSRNGTGYDVRMILIDGRKTGEFQRVFPPVKAKARAEQVTTFDELYKRVQDDIQQIQQVGSQSADVQREPATTTDGTAGAPIRSGSNRPNSGTGQRPGTTSDAVGDSSRTDSGQSATVDDGSRAAGVDNAVSGNAGSTDNVPQPKPRQSRSVGSGSIQNGTGRGGSDGRGAATSRPDSGTERLAVKTGLGDEKVPYPNQSGNGFTLMSVVPAAQAQALQKSLRAIGDVDQYLVDELGYSSKEELYGYLAAEQIDSVALAIHQMNNGNAFIIGDMTGVGKGRQGAALIRYGVKQGKVPIYFTQKPTLFTDNYRDLADIGSSDLRPFIIASNPKDANIVDGDGNIVHKLPSKKEQERVFAYIMEHGTLPDEYDYVLTTYDQIKNGTADYVQNEDGTWNTEARKLPKKSKGYTTADYNGQTRRDALAKLAEGNIAILDESHTVGGDSGCGRYMQMLTSSAGGVTFLSATFAKRADNMPIYAQRTAIAEAEVKASELIDAIMKGGVTLQEIMSKQLVESGQMIRRERSFEGVTIDWLSVEEETDRRQRAQFDEVAAIFNAIRNFQDDYITPIIDAKNEAAAERGATVGHTQGTKDMGVKNVPFASKMYNLVNQLLFALKVDAVADRVVENLRNGYKPVISFTNTMEGFLSSAPKGVGMDDEPNFSLTLMRALDGVMRFTEKDADENTDGGSISLSELSAEGQNAYNAIRDKITNLSADLPISPMDAIRMKIEEAGYSVAEITGRTMQLNRTKDGKYIVETRKDRDKKAAMRDFNSGKLDVLMINKSGSTGISLHASSKFEDQRQRVMVFAQFQSDINDEVQMRGRIDRSGQVTRGRYEYIMSTIPAEQRIQMMFKAKLKSLDANTTSSQKSKFNEMEIVDYLNKYGDEVVWEYMKEHPELEERLGDPLDMLQEKSAEDGQRKSEKEDTSKKTGCAGKISRYLAFLSVNEQDEIFKEITEAYRVKIQLLDDAGENDLEITTMPLRAETNRKQIWHDGVNPGSGNAFADNTYVEEVEVDVLKKPMKRDEIIDAARKLAGNLYSERNGVMDWEHYAYNKGEEIHQFYQSKADEALDKLEEAGEARIAKAREKAVTAATKARGRGDNNFTDEEIQSLADTVANEEREKEELKQNKRHNEIMGVNNRIQSLLNRLRAGSIYVVPQDLKQGTAEMFSQTFGSFVGFKFNKSYTLGSSTAIFATLDGRRKVELALSDPAINTIISATEMTYRYSPKEINAITMDNWDSKVPTQTRQKRYIITGNLLQALVDTEKGEKTKGNLISYSTIDGETRQGILMGENFKLTDLRNSVSLSSRLAQIREGKAVVSENGDVQISKEIYDWRHRGKYELRVPKSKQRGGIYTMRPELLKLVEGNNFITKGGNMVAYVTGDNIAKVVDMLSRAPFNLTVLQESKLTEAEDEVRYRIEEDDTRYRISGLEDSIVEYLSEYNSAEVVIIEGATDIVALDLPADVISDLKDCCINENIPGVYCEVDKKIYIFANKDSGMDIKSVLLHENIHAIIDSLDDGRDEFLDNFMHELSESPYKGNLMGRMLKLIQEKYEQEDVVNEYLTYMLQYSESNPGLRKAVLDSLTAETSEYLSNNILNRLYGKGQRDGREKEKDSRVRREEISQDNGIAGSLGEAEGGEALKRDGEGAYSDTEVSMENDPWSKAWGESLRSKREEREFARRERRRMVEHIGELADKLNLRNVEIVTGTRGLEGRKARAKGFFDKRTGKITVVIPNNVSVADVEQTLLHEAVAHYGLRQLLGEHFDEFLDKVYEAAENGIKEQIDLLASRNGWNRRVATEEYLAGLAEKTDFSDRLTGWFTKVKRYFVDMLRKIGFKHLSPGSIGDNELRYILWRSYENLANPGRYRAFEWEAQDVAMKYSLGLPTGYREIEDGGNRGVADSDGLDELNERFNEELEMYKNGELPDNHRFELGMPSAYLKSAGFPMLPISMRVSLLSKKSALNRHPFEASDLNNLVHAIRKPIAIFTYTKDDMRNLIVDVERDGKQFLVGVTLNYKANGIEINSVSGLFPKDSIEWLKWIQDGKAIRIDKKSKVREIIDSQRTTNTVESERIGLNLDYVTKIVENFENPAIREQNNNAEGDENVRFRDGDFTPRDRAIAAQQYERMLSRGSWQFREATQDSMLGLKSLYEAVLNGANAPGRKQKIRIEDVAGYENAYLYENRMSSANNGEQHQYFSRFMKPLLESIHKLCGSKELDRRILTDYMIAKHGLERNEYMRKEAAANGEDTERDFAGLCGLTGEEDWRVAETVARQMVDDYEADHDTAELWENVKKATNATLEKIYLSGLISEDTYNKVLGMYDFYIPLRGWDETTSDEVYGYLTSKDGPLMGNVFKTARGRNSKADDPIATVAMMADDAIRQGNRNIMKQRFLNFVHGNPSDLVSVNEIWLQHNDVTDEWEPVFADLQPDMTHAEVESEIAKFEAKMEALRTAEPDKYKKGRDARNIPYKVVRGNINEHQVLVKRNGRTYVMTINGNPRAAQALNGLTNPNVETGGVIGDLLKLGEYVNRHLSAFYTTRNPDFVVSNFLRDMLYSNCMTWVKENPRYALRFHKNFGKVNPLALRRLLSKWEKDRLSDSNYLEKMFKEFMLNGGETGYTSVKDIEGHKRTIASELKKQGSTGRKAWSALGMQLDLLNRSAENCARFAAFLTSREMGRSLDRSIHDAKEVSVNFNKKGSGGKFVNATGQKLLGKIGSYLGGGGRIAFVFWNAGVQGMTNFGRAGKRNPGKALGGAAALFTLGYVIPLLAQMLGGGDGDDDDKNAYYNLPEYVRRSNICFKAGEQWITIPLPIEYRAIYGMGELACGVISGNERYSNSELTRQMASQVSQVMPLDMLEGGGGISPFIPSAFKPYTEAYIMNKGWTGLPVYKDTPYNKNDPEWTKAYQSTDQHLVEFTKWVNETTGGDDYKKGILDINPAKLEYLLSGTFGGVVSTTGKLKKMGETALSMREFEWRNMLLANRVIKSGDERTANRKLQNEYFKYLNEYEETNRLRKKYEHAANDGILGYAERADFLYNSAEYLRYGIFEEYKPDIDAIREGIKAETDPEAKKELEDELFATMRELVDKLHNVDK